MQAGQSKESTTPLSLLPPTSWIPWATGLEMDKSNAAPNHVTKLIYLRNTTGTEETRTRTQNWNRFPGEEATDEQLWTGARISIPACRPAFELPTDLVLHSTILEVQAKMKQ
jgi:hypothetical protein